MYELIAEPLGGGQLTSAVLQGTIPQSAALPRLRSSGEWNDRIQRVAHGWGERWFESLAPAFHGNAGDHALDRLRAAVRSNGVVVTTGQQPGLFGGPLYTWFKAMTAVAFADELQRLSGIPVAPVFWAATDDSDFAEASWTAVSLRGGSKLLRTAGDSDAGIPMIRMPLVEADVRACLSTLRESAGPAASSAYLDVVEQFYLAKGASVGTAYVGLLRAVLEPLGVAVLDAAHPAVRGAAYPHLRRALERADKINHELEATSARIRARGMEPQVHEMPELSLVFEESDGVRKRIPLSDAARVLRDASDISLSPNVLLRPVIERAILPTVAYVGGPAEAAYFEQSAAVAGIMELAQPYVVPRWSGTVIEEHVRRILERYAIVHGDLADPHEVWGKLARNSLPQPVLAALANLRESAQRAFDGISAAMSAEASANELEKLVGGGRAAVQHKIARFERRVLAAAKRRDTRLAEDIATARGALFPLGKRQERALNIIPLLARYDRTLLEDVREHATAFAARIIRGEGNAHARQPAARESAMTAGG